MDGSHSDLSTENVFVLNLDQAKRNLSTLAHQTNRMFKGGSFDLLISMLSLLALGIDTCGSL